MNATPFCYDCPDHEGCSTGYPCWKVKELHYQKEKQMSADNGWILRKNSKGEFVLTEYSASKDDFPEIDGPNSQVFPTLPQAIAWYEQSAGFSEYGLTVKLKENSKEKTNAFVGEYVNHNHIVVQHRDGKPPWCNVCKLTSDFRVPISRLDKEEKHSPKDISKTWDSIPDFPKNIYTNSIMVSGLIPSMDETYRLIPVEFEITDFNLINKIQNGSLNGFSLFNVKEKEE